MIKQLHELLCFERPLRIVDIGANPIDGAPPYKKLLDLGLCQVIGFEPQPTALAALNRAKSPNETYLPYAVGDGAIATLNICKYSGWTSTLTPSAASLNVFTIFQDNAQIAARGKIKTVRLDDVTEVREADYLKIDIQGGELPVFQNAARLLSMISVVHTEVSFLNLYDNQPLFTEIDQELRRHGFVLHCFDSVKRGLIAPFTRKQSPGEPFQQLLEGDAIYVKDFRNDEKLDSHQLRTMALTCHVFYGSYDLAYRCLHALQKREAIPLGSTERYLELANATAS